MYWHFLPAQSVATHGHHAPNYHPSDALITVVDQASGTNVRKPTKAEELNPWGLEEVPYERYMVEYVDKLIEVAKNNGSKGRVQTSLDWKTMEFIYKGWKVLYPKSSQEFESNMKLWRLRANDWGVSKEKGGAMIQHQLEVPMPLYQLIAAIFTDQTWDKKFVKSFARHFPQFMGSDKQ